MSQQGNFVVAQASQLILHAAKADEASVRGLNSMTLPLGWSATTQTVSEFGVPIDVQYTSGLTYEPITCAGNFTTKDPTQAELRKASLNSTHITDMRFYLDNCAFAALDLISNAGGFYQIGSVGSPNAEKSGVYASSFEIAPAGQSTLFENTRGGITLSFAADTGTGATCTDSTSDFVNQGFKAGQIAYIDYMDGLDPLIVEIESVAAGQLTFAQGVGDEPLITIFVGIAATRITSGEPMAFDEDVSVCA